MKTMAGGFSAGTQNMPKTRAGTSHKAPVGFYFHNQHFKQMI